MSNLTKLKNAVATKNLGPVLISDINSVRWATGFTGSNGYVLLNGDEGVFITDSRYTIQAREQVKGLPTEAYSNPTTLVEFLTKQCERLGINKLCFEASIPYSTFSDWSSKLGGIELVPMPDVVGELRLVKTAEEIELIRAACKLADRCFDHVRRFIQPGVAEYDLGLEIEFFFRRHGAKLAFDPAVVSGERSARPHGRPSERKLQLGDFLTLDFGAELDGYCSDITRTVVIGEPSPRHVEVYTAVLDAQMAALQGMKPGLTGKEADALARDVLTARGLGEYFGHGLGHGLGRLVHDGGSLSTGSKTMIQAGQVWTVEPGAYIEGFGGVRIEDDVVVTESGVDVLTNSPKHLMVFPEA